MFGLGIGELVIVLVVVVVFFGASRLPKLGQGVGEAISGFKKAVRNENDSTKIGPEGGL